MDIESSGKGRDETRSASSCKKRVLVIALDGATWDLLSAWIAQGLLPNLARLTAHGVSAQLRSTLPPITPVAWLTFATSKNAAYHHVYDFFRPIRSSYTDLIPSTADLNRQPTLWSILSQRRRKVGVMNVPMTYPSGPVDGFLIPGIPTPNCADPGYPAGLVDELRQMGWDLTLDAAVPRGSYSETLSYLHSLIKARAQAAVHLLLNKDWDFFMVHFLETDQAAHTFWRFMDQKNSPLQDAILSVYRRADEAIGQILGAAGDAIVVVMSDHGMGPTHFHINLNNWLLQEGFMRWKRRPRTALRRLSYRLGLSPSTLYKLLPPHILQRLTLSGLRTGLAQITTEHVGRRHSPLNRLVRKAFGQVFLSLDDVDWSRTLAYSTGTTETGLIYLNVKDREPEGIVSRGSEYQRIREELVRRLEGFADPWTGRSLVRRVYLREEIYHGPYLDDAPDLLVEYRHGEYDQKKGSVFLSVRPVEPVRKANATHRLDGILVLYSPGVIRDSKQLESAHIRDITPTILYLMGEAVPSELEGSVLQEAITQAHLTAYPIQFSSTPIVGSETERELSSQELETVLERLHGLGYIA